MQNSMSAWQYLQGYIVDRITKKGLYIFDAKDDDDEAHLVPYNVDYYLKVNSLIPKIFQKVMVKFAIMYDLDNTDIKDITDEKLLSLANIYNDFKHYRNLNNLSIIEQENYAIKQFVLLLNAIELVNIKAVCGLVIDHHVLPYLEDAGEMLW